jgi:hypothetical protein
MSNYEKYEANFFDGWVLVGDFVIDGGRNQAAL